MVKLYFEMENQLNFILSKDELFNFDHINKLLCYLIQYIR